ncbi:DUF3800 domain-containing protein [Vibrio sp. 10N.222.54.F6]|uniref:DUF3800 domain-containing protein n=1 Tax=unclassified Vibrio TaxID=2614977 RepID=UPI000C82C71B|nr:DUF3800 domain-containing protein [Vibrio sp. 10N.261.51.A7]PML73469.1 hypothetical protein BCT71_07845 [Vibrio sp. 10N.261.51.A7]
MHIAIDDTYGPNASTNSKFVTGNRRTNVGIVFPDDEVDYIRDQIKDCLRFIKEEFSVESEEFHFVEIYNRKSPWDKLPDHANLGVLEAFAEIYTKYKWKVFIQTIDDRTLRDHGIVTVKGKVNQFHLEKPSDLSLFWLLIKIKKFYFKTNEKLTVFVDEGLGKPNADVGNEVFHDYPNEYLGKFQSSSHEPLLQLADFIAFIVNRSTHLYMKENRTDTDNWFLELFNYIDINTDDLAKSTVDVVDYRNFTISDFDELHTEDRRKKGL